MILLQYNNFERGKDMDKKKIIIALVVVVLLIVTVFAVITIRKVSILNNLIAKGTEMGKLTNYHVKLNQEAETNTDAEVWRKDNEHFLVKMTSDYKDGFLHSTMYRNGDEQFRADEIGEQKIVIKATAFPTAGLTSLTEHMSASDVWKYVNQTSIRSVQLENKDCYEIVFKDNDMTVWIEKETGLIIKRQTTIGIDRFSYEIGTVTDADVQKPDLTGYTEMDQQ